MPKSVSAEEHNHVDSKENHNRGKPAHSRDSRHHQTSDRQSRHARPRVSRKEATALDEEIARLRAALERQKQKLEEVTADGRNLFERSQAQNWALRLQLRQATSQYDELLNLAQTFVGRLYESANKRQVLEAKVAAQGEARSSNDPMIDNDDPDREEKIAHVRRILEEHFGNKESNAKKVSFATISK